MSRSVTLDNNPLALAGRPVKTGTPAPRCTLVDRDMVEVDLKSYGAPVKLVHFFMSLDTPVCDLQIREFNRRTRELPEGKASVVGVSKDLPFAQRRFCDTFDIANMALLSDYRRSSFGLNYGVLIRELNLLARGVIVIDAENTVRYQRLVEELTDPPDFDEAFRSLEEAIKAAGKQTVKPHDPIPTPPDGMAALLSANRLARMLEGVHGWELVDGRKIRKSYTFTDFSDAKNFIDTLYAISEERGHHPSIGWNYNRVQVTLTTHEAGGLTGNDFATAGVIDQLEGRP